LIRNPAPTQILEAKEEKGSLVVDVEGAVLHPGVYYIEAGSIVDDAIKKAGGLSSEADKSYVEEKINRAQLVTNHAKIYIPRYEKRVSISTNPNLININTASLAELDRLPGVGPITAQEIIDYRKTYGGFKNISELLNVPQISQSDYEKIKDKVTIQ